MNQTCHCCHEFSSKTYNIQKTEAAKVPKSSSWGGAQLTPTTQHSRTRPGALPFIRLCPVARNCAQKAFATALCAFAPLAQKCLQFCKTALPDISGKICGISASWLLKPTRFHCVHLDCLQEGDTCYAEMLAYHSQAFDFACMLPVSRPAKGDACHASAIFIVSLWQTPQR